MLDFQRSVAIIGRPNVGKSRLFNRLVGKRMSIVHDQPGVTRDVISAEIDNDFILMDTGGIGLHGADTDRVIAEAMEEQVDFAIQAAHMILFVVDGSAGLTLLDREVAQRLRRYGKPICLVINKIDLEEHESRADAFYPLGMDVVCPLSAEHGRNVGALFEFIHAVLGPPPPKEDKDAKNEPVRFSLIGRPNVGKSSIGNRLLNSERLIVSNVAGTTRESVGALINYTLPSGDDLAFELVDTAGFRARRKIDSSLEYFSSLRSEEALKRSDVVVQVIDAETGVAKLDKKIAGDALAEGRGLVLVVNKWDRVIDAFRKNILPAYKNENHFKEEYEKAIRKELFFLPNSPILFVSAQRNEGIPPILEAVYAISKEAHRQFPTAEINKLMAQILEKQEPRMDHGRRFKIYYALQVGVAPLRIRAFCNSEDKLEDSYRRYMSTQFTKAFDIRGVPLFFEFVGKPPKE